ncbi:7518_t:CDS:2, partial [Scutellospora calospora]
MNLLYILVSSIVLETYSEIGSLTEDFNQLQRFYQSEKDYEIEIKNVLETNELVPENTDNIDDNEETQYFDNQNTIKENNEEQEASKKVTTLLDQQDKDTFIHKLYTTICCKTRI